MLHTLLLEVMSCAIKAKFHTMMMFGERATAKEQPQGGATARGQPQGGNHKGLPLQYIIKCRGNPLWLPLWTHFEA